MGRLTSILEGARVINHNSCPPFVIPCSKSPKVGHVIISIILGSHCNSYKAGAHVLISNGGSDIVIFKCGSQVQ